MIKFNKAELTALEQKLQVAVDTLKNKDASTDKQVQAAKFILKNEGLVSRSNVLFARKLLTDEEETQLKFLLDNLDSPSLQKDIDNHLQIIL